MNKLDTVIHTNNTFIKTINQLLHNSGIEFSERMDLFVKLLNKQKCGDKIDQDTNNKILAVIDDLILDRSEIYQIIFMFFCDKKTKIDLDQYYTPYTICDFISKLLLPNKKVIDPACGTGDLVRNYNGCITLCDISSSVLDICKKNYSFINKFPNIECMDSILNYDKYNNTFDYCVLNPPFGSSTVIKNRKILDNYELGKDVKQQEIGLLFIERSINLLMENGILFAIVPNGYLGNSTKNIIKFKNYILRYRIIAIIELPSNTFSRSGTGVSTSLIIIQKTFKSYSNIFIKKIDNIGYFLNKKYTPYKYKTSGGEYILNDGKLVLDNDLNTCFKQLTSFSYNENIKNIFNCNNETHYEILNTEDIIKHILDINRYLHEYKYTVTNSIKNNYIKLGKLIEPIKCNNYIEKNKEYLYLDIKQIFTPIYNKTNLVFGYDLPSRAKIFLKKYDIIVSKLKGKIKFTIILDDKDNIICTNGFCLLRCSTFENTVIIFGNLFTNEFKIQHNSLCTGSIMESLTEKDLYDIYINPEIELNKYINLIDSLKLINSLSD